MSLGFRRILGIVLLSALLVSSARTVRAEEDTFRIISETAVLIDADTGRVLYDKNCHQRMYPASITKIMTGMLALKNLQPDDVLTMTMEAYVSVPRTAANIFLAPGEELTLDQAMNAMTVESANDVANLLGTGVSGDLTSFAELMTQEAASLGALDTHFANANGLNNPNHYTTAYDMALITAEAIRVPGFTDYFSAVTYDVPPTNLYGGTRNLKNGNLMLSGDEFHDDRILMSKTGWTEDAGHTLVTAARQGDVTLIAVVMQSSIIRAKYEDTWALLNYGFENFTHVSVPAETAVPQLNLGEYLPVEGQAFSYLLPVGTDPEAILFSLPADADPETGEVTLHAEFQGEALPSQSLTLFLPIPETEPETEPQTEPPTTQPQPKQEESTVPAGLLAIPAALLAAAVAVLIFLRKKKKVRS